MTTPWTLTYAYLAYTLAALLAVVNWVGEVVKGQLYDRTADGRLNESWLELAHWLAQYLRFFIIAGWLLTLAGLLFAAVSAGQPAEAASHKSYLLRLAAVVFAALCLSYVGHGDLSRYHVDLVAAVFCAWALWVIFAGWTALAGAPVASGPAFWWLGLAVVALLILRLIALIFFVSPDSPGQF